MNWLVVLALLIGCIDGEHRDRDGDGFETWELGGPDCDDANPSVNPSVSELCGNGIDDDCDGFIDDDGVGSVAWYPDADGDGYGAEPPQTGCAAPADSVASVANGVDCDDTNASAHPGADEVWYDGVDQDCAGGDDYDADADGYPAGSGEGQDCDDFNELVNPGSVEVCNNGWDDDCSGGAPECELVGEVTGVDAGIPLDVDGIAMADFDGDGVDDIAVFSEGDAQTDVWSSIPDAGPRRLLARVTDADCVWTPVWSIGDVTGDGIANLASTCSEESLFVVFPSPLSGGARVTLRGNGLRLADRSEPALEDDWTSRVDAGSRRLVPVDDFNGDGIVEMLALGTEGPMLSMSPHSYLSEPQGVDWLAVAGPAWTAIPPLVAVGEPFPIMLDTGIHIAELGSNTTETSMDVGSVPVAVLLPGESDAVRMWPMHRNDDGEAEAIVARLGASDTGVPVLTVIDPASAAVTHEVTGLGTLPNTAGFTVRRPALPCDLNADGESDLVMVVNRTVNGPEPYEVSQLEVYYGPAWRTQPSIAPDVWSPATPWVIACTPDGVMYHNGRDVLLLPQSGL